MYLIVVITLAIKTTLNKITNGRRIIETVSDKIALLSFRTYLARRFNRMRKS